VADQEKLFLTELRLCGESNHWRVDARYTGTMKEQEGDGGDSANQEGKQEGKEEKKKSPLPEEVTLSILIPAGDRSIVDLQIDAMDRAMVLLQETISLARAEQRKRTETVRE